MNVIWLFSQLLHGWSTIRQTIYLVPKLSPCNRPSYMMHNHDRLHSILVRLNCIWIKLHSQDIQQNLKSFDFNTCKYLVLYSGTYCFLNLYITLLPTAFISTCNNVQNWEHRTTFLIWSLGFKHLYIGVQFSPVSQQIITAYWLKLLLT